jgi:endonuclease III
LPAGLETTVHEAVGLTTWEDVPPAAAPGVRYNQVVARRKFTRPEQERRTGQILEKLASAYPDAECALLHTNVLELLIATILSAQCTDERVNIVTRDLFRKYRRPEDYLRVSAAELENDIRTTGFYRNKAKSIQGACRMILDEFRGKVPNTMDELLRLPGVARKTANVVLGVMFQRAEGIVVDTHVFRLSRRLELASAPTPEKVEAELMRIIPRDRWIAFSHQVIQHGRRVCKARKPECPVCPLEQVCRSADKVL